MARLHGPSHRLEFVWNEPAHSGELQLPDLISVAYSQRTPALAVDPVEPNDIFGVNTLYQLTQAEKASNLSLQEPHLPHATS